MAIGKADHPTVRTLWVDHPELTAEAIGERYGTTRNAVIGLARRSAWPMRRGPRVSTLALPPDGEALRTQRRVEQRRSKKGTSHPARRLLREIGLDPDERLTDADLAQLPSMSLPELESYPEARTTLGRLDALNATLDAVLAVAAPERRPPRGWEQRMLVVVQPSRERRRHG